jgi:hypothetical protein
VTHHHRRRRVESSDEESAFVVDRQAERSTQAPFAARACETLSRGHQGRYDRCVARHGLQHPELRRGRRISFHRQAVDLRADSTDRTPISPSDEEFGVGMLEPRIVARIEMLPALEA